MAYRDTTNSVMPYHCLSRDATTLRWPSLHTQMGSIVPSSTMTQELIGPEQARAYLSCNRINRKLRLATVKRYEEEMLQNAWTLTSDAIAFDDQGNLIQGQHRLTAILRTNTSHAFWVCRGLPSEAKGNLDNGTKRELHDRLTIAGHSISKSTASACIKLATPWRAEHVVASKNPMFRNSIIKIHDHFYEEFEWLDKKIAQTVCTAGERAAAAMLLKLTNGDYLIVKDFISLIRTGRNTNGTVEIGQTSPITYRDIKMKEKAKKNPAGTMTFYRLATSAAFNLFIRKDVKRLNSYVKNPFVEAGVFGDGINLK